LSKARRRALEILRDNPGVTAGRFGHLMWPDAEGHKHHTKCGNKGVSVGGGMNLAAGGFLGKLIKAGLVVCTSDSHYYKGRVRFGLGEFHLAAEGRKALKEE